MEAEIDLQPNRLFEWINEGKTYLLIMDATALKTSAYNPITSPSKASNPETSLSNPLSVGDGVLNGCLGAFGVTIPPDDSPKVTRDSSSAVVPNK